MDDFVLYTKTITDPASDIYTDNFQEPYDAYDTYQGCKSWYEYQEEWN